MYKEEKYEEENDSRYEELLIDEDWIGEPFIW